MEKTKNNQVDIEEDVPVDGTDLFGNTEDFSEEGGYSEEDASLDAFGDFENSPDYASAPDILDNSSSAIVAMLQKTNRLLTENEKIAVVEDKKTGDVAFADPTQHQIFINFQNLKNYTHSKDPFENLINLKGVNYHELSHLLFTDYSARTLEIFARQRFHDLYFSSKATNTSQTQIVTLTYQNMRLDIPRADFGRFSFREFFNIMNILEDCRIENLFFSQYPRAQFYFTFTLSSLSPINLDDISEKVNTGIINPRSLISLYLLWYGRKFVLYNPKFKPLLKQFRDYLVQSCITPQMLRYFEDLIDDFIVETDVKVRSEIGFFMYSITLQRTHPSIPPMGGLQNPTSSNSIRAKGTLATQRRIKDATDDFKKYEDQETERDKEDFKETPDEMPGEVQDTDTEENDGTEGQKGHDGATTKDKHKNRKEERDGTGEGLNSDDVNDISGNGTATSDTIRDSQDRNLEKKIEKDISKIANLSKKILETIKKEVTENSSIMQEIETDIQRLQGEKSDYVVGHENIPFIAGMNEIGEARRVESVLKQLRANLSASVTKNQEEGEIDIESAIQSEHDGTLNIFEKKLLNRIGKAKMGVVFLLDASGSVNETEYKQELKATWCLTEGLERLGNKVEIMEFSSKTYQHPSGYRMLKTFRGKGDWRRQFGDGTYIVPPAQKAIADLLALRRNENIQNLFIIAVTDGSFSDKQDDILAVFNQARRSGIKTMWIYANPNANGENLTTHIFDWFICIRNFAELSMRLQGIIRDIQRKIVEGIQRGGN